MILPCPFCSPTPAEIILQNPLCFARYDRYPVSRGHILIIPFRHISDFFELTVAEQESALELIREAKTMTDADLQPQGYNVGFNVGRAAGQTIPHVHVHLIPRFDGDMDRPEGGVRGVIPEKRLYSLVDMPQI